MRIAIDRHDASSDREVAATPTATATPAPAFRVGEADITPGHADAERGVGCGTPSRSGEHGAQLGIGNVTVQPDGQTSKITQR
jgi:hypothetical protein